MNLSFGTLYNKLVDIPLTCPYCGKVVEFTPNSHHSFDFNDGETFHIYLLHSKCCNKLSIATYHKIFDKNADKDVYKFVSMYPNPKLSVIPENIQKLSPRFYTLFNDSEFAFSQNMFELAGSGYRNSLEILIKDYAIKELEKDPEEVSKKKLFDAIDAYLPNQKLKNSADVVRILGNDCTHFEQKYEEYDLDVLKAYLDIFVTMINAEYMVNHPPVARNQKN